MKKIIFSFLMAFISVIGVKAQIAVEESKVLDNIYVGVTGGATTPLDFNSVFPVNPVAGLKVGKEITPVLGFEVEGLAILNDNHWTDIKTAVKGTNVGLNGIVNLSNLFAGYPGTPRTIEFKTNTGLGWLHTWNTSNNNLTAKTGLDVQLNLGKTKAHSITITPAVYWNLNKLGAIKFTKQGAQFGLFATYAYHFKTSNGTRHFKSYDVGAMIGEIDRLNQELAKKPKEVEVIKYVDRVVNNNYNAPVTNAVALTNSAKWIVPFANNSAELLVESVFILNQIGQNTVVDIVATTSETGTDEYNQKLSEKRAKAVADFLTKRGVKVNSAVGKGKDAESGRTAIVTTAK